MAEFSHFDEQGQARMVEVGAKENTRREAVARGEVKMRPETLAMVLEGKMGKGDVLGVARIAGIMAAKKTSSLIPLCHPISITGIDLEFSPNTGASSIDIEARVRCTGQTGVEMEALTAVSVAALTVYDMCKAVDKEMVIDNIRLVYKSGGKSGTFKRD